MAQALVVLAAGQGSRMLSDQPKVLHQIGCAPLLAHAIASGAGLSPDRVVVVAGHGYDQVAEAARQINPEIRIARQDQQLGTGHAVRMAQAELSDFSGDITVLYGDTPFIQPETLARMADARVGGADLVMLGFEAADPGRYGRMIIQGDDLLRIVEWKDASEAERAVTLCNSGVLMGPAPLIFDLLTKVTNDNEAGEYYLTDLPALAAQAGYHTRVVTCDEAETLGVNTRAELAQAEAIFQSRARDAALARGVTLQAPETVYFSLDTHLGRDVTVDPHVIFGPGVTAESGAHIRAFSHLEGCHVGQDAVVGPYARLRPGAELGNGSRIGNFVEVKSAEIGEGAKVNHLSYVGDAGVGDAANIGAGTITCNYDGVMKHRTEIGARAFIGSNTALVAPVRVGDDAMTASGSVITFDVPDGALGVARARQEVKAGLARRLMDRLRAVKAKKG